MGLISNGKHNESMWIYRRTAVRDKLKTNGTLAGFERVIENVGKICGGPEGFHMQIPPFQCV